MNLNQLQYFVKAVELQSISKAAEALYVNQPTLSVAIQNLEMELGHYLLLRNRRGVMPTDFGEKVYIEACNIFERIENIHQLAENENTKIQIKVVSIAALICSILPEVVQRFSISYPEVQLNIAEEPMPGGYTNVTATDYNFILTNKRDKNHVSAGVSKKKSLNSHVLFQDNFRVFCSCNHPLAHKDFFFRRRFI